MSEHKEALKTSGIEQLLPPGPDSNYLDWAFVVKLHLAANNLEHVLTDGEVKSHPITWAKDNLTVNSIFTKTMHKSNMRYIRDHKLSAAAGWTALKEAHQDSSSGGRMFWLRRLILCRMEDEDIEKHIESMNTIYERLNSLITPAKPLTADDIYATALLISLPTNWLPSVTHLLNQPNTTSSHIVTALKSESTRRSSSMENQEPTFLAARAFTPSSKRPSKSIDYPLPHRTAFNPDLQCSFCLSQGHDVGDCRTAHKILNEHKRTALKDHVPSRSSSSGSSSQSHSRSRYNRPAKAQAVRLGGVSEDDVSEDADDSDASEVPTRALAVTTRPKQFARSAVASALLAGTSTPSRMWTIDSACSRTMTPHLDNLSNLVNNNTSVNLADDSVIPATKSGFAQLPFKDSPLVSALVVPHLHEPLLSVADVCDKGLAVIFTRDGCDIYAEGLIKHDVGRVGSGH